MNESDLKISGDWTYEKSWQSPEEVIITYEKPINPYNPADGVEQATAEYKDHQYSEIHTQYQTFTYVDENNENKIQDLVIKRIRTTYLNRVSLCPNYFKWCLEGPKRGEPQVRTQNPQHKRIETTEYDYELAEDGWVQNTEQTTVVVSGYEYLGALPVKEFQAFKAYHGGLLANDYVASKTFKQYFTTNIAANDPSGKTERKRIYSRVTTFNKTMFAFTQEGQQYVQDLLAKENGARKSQSDTEYWRTLEAWIAGKQLTSDGATVNSSIGRLAIEQKPDEYDEAEEDLDDDDSSDEDGDTANSNSENQSDQDSSSSNNNSIFVGPTIDLRGGDLDDRWSAWSPYENSGNQINPNPTGWEGDPLKSSDTKPQYEIAIGGTGSRPPGKGFIRFNTSDARSVSQISMSRVSRDGYWTADFTPGQRIMVNSWAGGCIWWYLIRSVSNDGQTANVRFIDDILDTEWMEQVCDTLNQGWLVKCLVTSKADRGDRVFEMPYAPDDFMMCRDGNFVIVPGNAAEAAARYIRVQKRLLDGQDKGINVTTSLRQIPSDPFSDIYLNMLGTSIYGRTNGTSWAFNESGCVVSTDIIYGGHAGQDGSQAGLRTRAGILEAARECPVQQSEGWVAPPDGMTVDQLPVIYPDYAEPGTARKADTIEVDYEFNPDNPPCEFWTDDLPLGMYDEVAAETVTTNHVFVEQDQPYLVGRVRARAKVWLVDGPAVEQGELIPITVKTGGYSDTLTTDYYPKPTISRTMTYSIVKGWQPGQDDPDNPDPPGPEGPDIDCTLRVKQGFGQVADGGMYLGITDGGNRYSMVSTDGNDPWAIKAHPNYWQFEQGPGRENSEVGFQDRTGFNFADMMDPKPLIQPLYFNGKAYNWYWVTTVGTVFFTEKDRQGSYDDGIFPDGYSFQYPPGQYGIPCIYINTACNVGQFVAIRESANSTTIRFQGCSYDGFFDREGAASIVWELTIYARDPEIDQPLQLIELKSSAWDQEDDTWLDGTRNIAGVPITEWSTKVILNGGVVNNNLAEFEMPSHTWDDVRSWVFTANLEGTNWAVQEDRHVESECSYITQVAVCGIEHKVESYESVNRELISIGHSAYPVGQYNLRICSDAFERPNWTAPPVYVTPGKLYGIYPSFYMVAKADGGNGLFYQDHVCNSGQPYMTPGTWKDTDGLCNEQIQAMDIAPNVWPYERELYFVGQDKSDEYNVPNPDYKTNPIGKIGYDKLGHDAYSTNLEYSSEDIPLFLVWHGTAPQWTYDGIDKQGRGAPYRRSVGHNHTVLFMIANRGEVAPWEKYFKRFDYDGNFDGWSEQPTFEYPRPEKVCPDTGTYLWNAPTITNPDNPKQGWTSPAPLDWAQYLLQFAWPMRHGQGRKPTWAIYGNHFERWWGYNTNQEENFRVVYFTQEYGQVLQDEEVPYQTQEPYMAWEYLTAGWTYKEDRYYAENPHFDHWMQNTPIWVDDEAIYLKLGAYQVFNEDPRAPDYAAPPPDPDVYTHGWGSDRGSLDAGYSIIAFFDDPKSCVTRYIAMPEVGENVKVNTGWRPDIAFIWPVGKDQGFQRHYKSIIFSVQQGYGDGDPDETNIEQGYYGNDSSDWVICQQIGSRTNVWDQAPGAKERFIQDYQGNFAYRITDDGFEFRRLRNFDLDEYGAEGTETGRDLKMFVCLQRQQPIPNSTVGQFFCNGGLADFTYSAAAVGHGEFKIIGQELLKMDGALPYPPFELNATLFFGGGQQIGYTYLRWLRLKAEAGEVELDTAAPSYTRLIFCCYPDLDATGAQEFHLEGFEAGYSLVFHMDAVAWPGTITGQEIGFTYIRNLHFHVQPGEFEAAMEPVIFNYRRGMRLVGDIFRTRGWDAALLERGRMLQAEATRVLLQGGSTGAPRVHAPLTCEAGAFATSGGDSDGIQGNSFYGTFNLQGQEIGGSVTQTVPLLLECGNFQSEGFDAESEIQIPSDFPRQTLVAWHKEYTGTGHRVGDTDEVTISGVPFSPALVWSFPADFPLAIRDRTLVEFNNYGLHGMNPYGGLDDDYFSPRNEGGYRYASWGDWMFNRVVGRVWPMQLSEAGMRQAQPSALKAWTEDGVQLGTGENMLGDRTHPYAIGDDHSAHYNFKTGNEEYDLPDPASRNFALKYTLFFLRINHPACEGLDDQEYLEHGPNWEEDPDSDYSDEPYSMLNKDTVYPPHAVGVEGFCDYGQIPVDMQMNTFDPDDPNNDYRPYDTWYYPPRPQRDPGDVKAYITREAIDEAMVIRSREDAFNHAWDQNKENNPYSTAGPTTWRDQKPLDELGLHNAGRYWYCTDQVHGGIAIGAFQPPYESFVYRRSLLVWADWYSEPRWIEEEETDSKSNRWFRYPSGLDSTPDLLMLIPVGISPHSDQNSPEYEGWEGYYNTMCWYVPTWGKGRGVRCIGTDEPSTVFDLDQSAMYGYNNNDDYGTPEKWRMPEYDAYEDEVWGATLKQFFWAFDGDGFILPDYNPQTNQSQYVDCETEQIQPSMSWIAIKNTPGYVMTGTYSGNGLEPLWVSCSFRPGMVMAKATTAPCTGMYVHMRPTDPRVDGQTEYTLCQGTPQYDTTTGEPVEPNVGWQPRARGPQSLSFQQGGFYVPPGAVGNDADAPGQTVTWVAFAVEHMRIHRCAGEPARFEGQGQEIGGKILQRVERCEAGSFAVNPGESTCRIWRHNPNPTVGTSSVGGFWLRGMDGNPVLSAPAGDFHLAGHARLMRPVQKMQAAGTEFRMRGGEMTMFGPLVARAGNFHATLQWVGGSYNECRQRGVSAPQVQQGRMGTATGSIPLVGGNDQAANNLQMGGWTIHRDSYRDDGYYEIALPEGFEIVITGHTIHRLWASTNGLFTFESGDSTYSIQPYRPAQRKLMLQAGDRCVFVCASIDLGDGTFIVRNHWGASYSTSTVGMISEVTFFAGYDNIIQCNWGIQNVSSSYFGVYDSESNITTVNGSPQADTTYVFESTNGGTTWTRHDDAHFVGGPIIRKFCLYPLVHEMQLIGGDSTYAIPTYIFRCETGRYAVQGRIP